MSEGISQPTILIKKADGTTERITLAELKKRQSGVVAVSPVVMTPVPASASPEKSLLQEETPPSEHATTVIAPARLDQVEKIILSLSFKAPAQIESRLRSCIQLRLKDIRSEADTVDLCLRSIKDGGLGLTQTQAEEIALKAKPSAIVANNPPKENVVEKIISQNVSAHSDNISDLVAKPNTSPTRPPATTFSKPQMHDVKSKPTSMNPLEEIQYFSLVDFRRLSSNASEAANRLKQKFVNIRDESYLLFMQSWSSWQISPLFVNYVEAVDDAVYQKKHLVTTLVAKDKISLAEIEALIKMEKDLDL